MYLQFSGVYFIDSNSDFSDPDPYFVPIRTQEKKSNPDPNKPGSETMFSTQNEKGAQEQKGTPKNNFNPFCGSQSRSTCCWSRQKRNGYVTLRLINNVPVVKKKTISNYEFFSGRRDLRGYRYKDVFNLLKRSH